MQVDVKFDFAKVYNTDRFDVVNGQKFSLITGSQQPLRWFADNDPALKIDAHDTDADFEATATGQVTLYLYRKGDNAFEKEITINVVAGIDQAAALNPEAAQPENK
jgi:hypothetical protein